MAAGCFFLCIFEVSTIKRFYGTLSVSYHSGLAGSSKSFHTGAFARVHMKPPGFAGGTFTVSMAAGCKRNPINRLKESESVYICMD